MSLTPEQKAEGWIEWNGGECPIKDERTNYSVRFRDGVERGSAGVIWSWRHYQGPHDIIAYRILEAHGADADLARPTPFPASYDDLVFDADGWSQTIIVDGKRPEWLRDDDRCWGFNDGVEDGWLAPLFDGTELAIRVRRRDPPPRPGATQDTRTHDMPHDWETRHWTAVFRRACRHTAAVRMASAGIPMSRISQFLGHSNTSVTERVYARYAPDHLADAAAALEMPNLRIVR